MKFFFLALFYTCSVLAQENKDQILLINGGASLQSNKPRYYENIKLMYEAFKANGNEAR